MPIDKRAVHARFRASLPPALRDDRYFKIFYSDVRPSPVAVIGLNPGGDPARPPAAWGASLFYEAGEHDYVDCDYPIAVKMRALLLESGGASDLGAIRCIPKLNVIFHRSPSWALLADKDHARALAGDHVALLLSEVSPRLLLIEGFEAFAQLQKQQQTRATDVRSVLVGRVKTAMLSLAGAAPVRAVVLAHPTGARWSRAEWRGAIDVVASALRTPRSSSAGPRPQEARPTADPGGVRLAPAAVGKSGPKPQRYAPASLISGNQRIRIVAVTNPKKAGSASFVRFGFYRNGMRVADAIAAGVWFDDVRWDLAHGFIQVVLM